jgi:hypothetical protein
MNADAKPKSRKKKTHPVNRTGAVFLERHAWWKRLGNGAFMKPRLGLQS